MKFDESKVAARPWVDSKKRERKGTDPVGSGGRLVRAFRSAGEKVVYFFHNGLWLELNNGLYAIHCVNNHDTIVKALDEAILHLHELTASGEFASAIDGITISWAAGREFKQAHDAIDGFRVILNVAKGEEKDEIQES